MSTEAMGSGGYPRHDPVFGPSLPPGTAEPFPPVLRESVVDVMAAHARAELRPVETPTYGGRTFTQYVWVCRCGEEGKRPMTRASASRGHGLHRGAAERRLDRAQDAAVERMTEAERLAYIAWVRTPDPLVPRTACVSC